MGRHKNSKVPVAKAVESGKKNTRAANATDNGKKETPAAKEKELNQESQAIVPRRVTLRVYKLVDYLGVGQGFTKEDSGDDYVDSLSFTVEYIAIDEEDFKNLVDEDPHVLKEDSMISVPDGTEDIENGSTEDIVDNLVNLWRMTKRLQASRGSGHQDTDCAFAECEAGFAVKVFEDGTTTWKVCIDAKTEISLHNHKTSKAMYESKFGITSSTLSLNARRDLGLLT
ncbi:LOW QUALITY PROTEIN: Hypothetical protein PHPALM_329 [Phytophthora palmivora]|uniref:Uncharacterized protein n=1 Tax=Phytophthora palmivora TaxID=4796 RepID=A0A2P4YV28_9STRA|nr:LOW QUALITY PROTEIN: Hypothetical protein PHPALM_329 [Phytophthora palmivora]